MSGRTFTPAERFRSQESCRRRLDAEFWAKTDRSGECWIWTGARQSLSGRMVVGYGKLNRHGRLVYAHRYAYGLVNGPIPSGLNVLHHCDNPPVHQAGPPVPWNPARKRARHVGTERTVKRGDRVVTCQRCSREPATLGLAFRSGLAWTAEVACCQPCCQAMCAVTKTAARIVALEPFVPEWKRRGLPPKDMSRGNAA